MCDIKQVGVIQVLGDGNNRLLRRKHFHPVVRELFLPSSSRGLLLQPVPIQPDDVEHLYILGPELLDSLALGVEPRAELTYLLLRAVPHVFQVVLHVQGVDRMNLVASGCRGAREATC